VDRYARVHLVNNYYDTNGRSSTYQITLFDYFDLIAEGNSFTCPNNAWVYRTFGGEGYKGGELRKGLKMHVKMTDSFFYGKTLTIPPKKKGEPATSRFAYTTWGSPMLRFQRFYHPNASKDRKNNERNFLSFLLPENKEEFKGTHFVTYQHDVLKADKVKDHVLAHAGVSSNTDRRK